MSAESRRDEIFIVIEVVTIEPQRGGISDMSLLMELEFDKNGVAINIPPLRG